MTLPLSPLPLGFDPRGSRPRFPGGVTLTYPRRLYAGTTLLVERDGGDLLLDVTAKIDTDGTPVDLIASDAHGRIVELTDAEDARATRRIAEGL